MTNPEVFCGGTWQARNARVTINAVHPGIVKTAIIRAHKGFITGKNHIISCSFTINVFLCNMISVKFTLQHKQERN